MARYIEEGESIFIPFWKGYSITDSQLHLRMYKTAEMFKRYFPNGTNYDVLCEYAPVVRCKHCRWFNAKKLQNRGVCYHPTTGILVPEENDFCSYGERKDND